MNAQNSLTSIANLLFLINSKIISEIKKLDVALTLSIGEKSYEEYKAYKNGQISLQNIYHINHKDTLRIAQA